MGRYHLLRQRVRETLPGVRLHEAEEASDGELALAHEPAWITAVVEGTTSAAQQREIGFPWSERMVQRARRSVGATIQAARAALAGEGVAANLAGGTHHAYPHKGSGYCVFNDVAVGARLVQREGGRSRVLVVDTDVHQGDGTATIFADDPSVFTFSIHGDANFPAEKATSDLDVALPSGTGDEAYLAALAAGLAEALARSEPQFVFYLSGADAFAGDRLGKLALSKAGLLARDRMVFAALCQRSLPWVTVMGGGYGRVIDDSVDVYEATVRAALDGRA